MPKKQEPKKAKEETKSSGYGAEQIQVLEGLEPVRKRPGMYIGGTGEEGLHHLIWEVVDNSIDEAMAGHASLIEVTIHADEAVTVKDNGRGIPVETHKQTKKSTLETVLTILHAGGKFGGGGYKVSGGLHGVGVSVVNALSDRLRAEVRRDGKAYVQEYARGKAKYKVKEAGKSKESGTIITFHPDAEIFGTELKFSWDTIIDHLRQQAYLTKGVRIKISDERTKPENIYSFFFEGGIRSYVMHLNKNKDTLNEPPFYVEKEHSNTLVEVAIQYFDGFNENVKSFANNIFTPEGGMHLIGFRTSITRSINNYARKAGLIKDSDANLTGDDVREGLSAIISVKLTNPQFEGQTKAKLGNPEVRTAVETVLNEYFAYYLEENPNQARALVNKCLLTSRARIAAKAARETVIRKGALEGMTLPGKLADCATRDATQSEIYIVEGDSAGGCFFGETKVALLDGRNISFKELVEENKNGKKNYTYTLKNDGTVAAGEIINPRMTRKSAEVIKVILDNGEEVICTPDHNFRLTDGSYVEAKNLTSKMSLAPLYRKLSEKGNGATIEGYEMVFDSMQKKWIYTHALADQFNLDNGSYLQTQGGTRHHIDFDKRNNDPTNIVRMTHDQHFAYHRSVIEKTLHRPDVKQKSIEAKRTNDFREKARQKSLEKAELFSNNAKKQWENPEYKKFMTEAFLKFYSENADYRNKNNKLLNENQRKYWAKAENRTRQSKRVRGFLKNNPELKELLSAISKEQWSDQNLLRWRSTKTKEQWTSSFRAKRKEAYNKTYYAHTIKKLREVYENTGEILDYELERTKKRNTNLLKLNTFVSRFFDGDVEKAEDAVKNYNHKIKKIIKLKERVDVYDLEVPGTHNFALAAGVFVHNSAKQGRDRHFQAILPLRGKILNVERARMDKMLANEEIKSLIIALGVGIGETFDVARLRYHRIIIMTDADVDGAHIRTLLLTFFYRHMKEVVEQGYLYIAQPPLYRIQYGTSKYYVYSDEEKEKTLAEIHKQWGKGKDKRVNKKGVQDLPEGRAVPAEEELAEPVHESDDLLAHALEDQGTEEAVHQKGPNITIQRYKGLGEMNPGQLWETTMDPKGRILLKVTVHDAEEADELFSMLMGDEVGPRKKFIQTHAKLVENLDI